MARLTVHVSRRFTRARNAKVRLELTREERNCKDQSVLGWKVETVLLERWKKRDEEVEGR